MRMLSVMTEFITYMYFRQEQLYHPIYETFWHHHNSFLSNDSQRLKENAQSTVNCYRLFLTKDTLCQGWLCSIFSPVRFRVEQT